MLLERLLGSNANRRLVPASQRFLAHGCVASSAKHGGNAWPRLARLVTERVEEGPSPSPAAPDDGKAEDDQKYGKSSKGDSDLGIKSQRSFVEPVGVHSLHRCRFRHVDIVL